jgi:hypothetical protein
MAHLGQQIAFLSELVPIVLHLSFIAILFCLKQQFTSEYYANLLMDGKMCYLLADYKFGA